MKTMRLHPFTLIEVVAAMAVMTVVALIIGTASMTFYNSWKRTERLSDRLRTVLTIDRVMDQCVRGTVPFRWKNENNVSCIVFEGKEDTLLLCCLRRAYAGESSALLFLRLKLDGNDLVAEYSPYPRLQWEEEDETKYPVTKEILARNVQTLSFRYANMDDDNELEWVDTWREYDANGTETSDEDFLPVPLAIQMKVEFTDGTSEVWLRRTAGNSRNSTFEDES